MTAISNVEKGLFLKLFNREGYVLDFTTGDFNTFTMSSIGVALCEHYGYSKGKSLIAYVNNSNDESSLKLLSDLLEYYEAYYQREIECNANEFFAESNFQKAKEYQSLYKKCRQVIDRVNIIASPLNSKSDDLKKRFSSDYMTAQIDLMVKMQSENPTEAIGKSKELIESCCKTILEARDSPIDKNWRMPQLVKATMKELDVSTDNVNTDSSEGKIVKAILGNLHGVSVGVSELRNLYGSGHGKSASYKGLSIRHAKLAVGSSITLADYLWDTFEWKNKAK